MLNGPTVDLGIDGLTDAVEIAHGGFAVVYRAFQPRFERMVAAGRPRSRATGTTAPQQCCSASRMTPCRIS